MTKIKKIRIILWSFLFGLVFWLISASVVPGGSISYNNNFDNFNFFLSKLSPDDRIDDTAVEKKIIGDPIYFTLRAPRNFDKAKLTVTYRNESEKPIMEAGILADKVVWRYDLKPLNNAIIDGLLDQWPAVYSDDGLVLLQRNMKFTTVDDFLKNPPPTEKIAQYNYDLKKTFIITGYKPSDKIIEINQPLRGTFQFYVYLKNENLDISFIIKDINKNLDSDAVALKLYYDNNILTSAELSDDGVTTDKGNIKQSRSLKLSEANLPEGAYKIELKANNDIITEKIISAQERLVFISNIWLAKSKEKDFGLYTDSQQVYIKTTNPASLQNIKIGDDNLEIKETYKQYDIKTKESLSEIKIVKNDLIVAGDGVFSFDESALFNPSMTKVSPNFDPDKKAIDFVIARYRKPVVDGEYKISTAEFDLAAAYREDNKYSFIISIPGLKAEGKNQEGIIIKEIKVNLSGKSFWEKIKKYEM